MNFGVIAVLVSIGTVLAGIAATHPHELRPHRWLKIVLSLPIVLLITSEFYQLSQIGGYFAIWGFAILAFIWKSPMAHLGSLCVHRLIYGDMNRPTGVQPDFFGPKALRKHGDIKEAIHLCEQELAKEPLSYEGLLLLSELLLEDGKPERALKALESLGNAPLSDAQRKEVCARRDRIEQKRLVAELNAR
jgi:hypothetical protein